MRFGRWVIVGFLAALAVFSFFHLVSAGSDYKFLTTSDSGFFYGIARGINRSDGMIENYKLSHPPMGNEVDPRYQFHPLMLVMIYRGLNSLDPTIQLMDVAQYFAPFIFTLVIIGAFMAGREIGGSISGCASALFISTMVGSIYWTKIGAFDREITQIFFGTWLFFLMAKLFKGSGRSILKYSIISGIVYGLFLNTWSGSIIIAPIVMGALILVLISRIPSNYASAETIEDAIYRDVRENRYLIGGVIGMIGIATVLAVGMGGWSPGLWKGFTGKVAGFLGVGGGAGIQLPTYASEMGPATDYFRDLTHHLYDNELLMDATLFLVALGLVKAIWYHRRVELVIFFWPIVIAPMPMNQARFFRLFWTWWPILAGFGLGALMEMGRKLMFTPQLSTSWWADRVRNPLVICLAFIFAVTPLISNARAHATDTRPAPHGGSLWGNYYFSMVDSFLWLRENTNPESVVAIEWSYGHFLTGMAERRSVVDGTETICEEGKWQETAKIKPPDYIYRKKDSKGARWVGGRRIDVPKLTSGDENLFARIVRSYRENYNLKIDYVVFNLRRIPGALISAPENFMRPHDFSKAGRGNILIQFDNENILYNTRNNRAFYRGDGRFYSAAVVICVPRARGWVIAGWSGFPAYNMEFTLENINPHRKVLKVLCRGRKIVGFKCGELEYIPIVARVGWHYSLPSYLTRAHESPYNYAIVGEIHHAQV